MRALQLVLLLWVALVTVQIFLAQRELRDGFDASSDAGHVASPGELVDGVPLPLLERARDRFASAARRLDGALLFPVRHLPVLGRQVRTAASVTDAAEEASDLAIDALEQARTALDEGGTTGPARVALLREVATIAADAKERVEAIDVGSGRALLAPVADRRNELVERLVELDEGLARTVVVTRATADLLEGPRRYLLLAANNAEMRAGSGMFLTAGVLEVRDGQMEIGELFQTGDLQLDGEGVPLDEDYEARWGWLEPNREWRNLGATPAFDRSAPIAAAMWQQAMGETVDGVIAVDAQALEAVIAATGPVEVEGQVVPPDNVPGWVLHDQYLLFPEKSARRDMLGAVANAALEIVEEGDIELGVLAGEIAKAAGGRHILVWSNRPEEQRAWETAGVAGSLSPDSLLVGVMNSGGNKLDWFLETSNDLRIETRDDRVHVELEVHVANNTPEGEPEYIAGPTPGSVQLVEGEYRGLVSVTVPGAASDLSFEGDPALAAIGPDGPTNVIATEFRLLRGERRSFIVRFTLPAGATIRREPSGRVPPVAWRLDGEEAPSDAAAWTIHP